MQEQSYVAENIKRLCLEKAITYKELYEKAGISGYALNCIFKGSTVTRHETLFYIAQALGVKVSDLKAKPKAQEKLKYDLKQLCQLNGMTLVQLQEKAGVSSSAIRNIGRGKAKPIIISRVAKALNVPPEVILTTPQK